jgi:hypothetical protein
MTDWELFSRGRGALTGWTSSRSEIVLTILSRTALHSYFSICNLRRKDVADADESQYFKKWNFKMKTVRISIEWNDGVTASLFTYVARSDKLKTLKSPQLVSKFYTVATLFRNFHVALYGGLTT